MFRVFPLSCFRVPVACGVFDRPGRSAPIVPGNQQNRGLAAPSVPSMRRPLVVNAGMAGGGMPVVVTSGATARRVVATGTKEPLLHRGPGGRVGKRAAVVPAAGGKAVGLVPGGGGRTVGGAAVHGPSTVAGGRGTVPRVRSSVSALLPPGFHPQFESGTGPMGDSLHVGVRPARGRRSLRRSRRARQDAGRALQGTDRRPPDGAFEKEGDTVLDRRRVLWGSGFEGRSERDFTASQAAWVCTWP